jgi:hypothetical protein
LVCIPLCLLQMFLKFLFHGLRFYKFLPSWYPLCEQIYNSWPFLTCISLSWMSTTLPRNVSSPLAFLYCYVTALTLSDRQQNDMPLPSVWLIYRSSPKQ